MRYALLNDSAGIVENVIEIEDLDAWPLPEGCSLIQSDTASPGWILADGDLVAPPEPDQEEREH